MQREKLGSRLGFILISAGCAIGIGNVWKFPYITGQYGGGIFVLLYLLFLLIMGVPALTMEFTLGRAAQKSPVKLYDSLEKPGQKWHWHGYVAMAGNYLLMMFYTVVAGWMLEYFVKTATGQFHGLNPQQIGQVFDSVCANPWLMLIYTGIVIVIGFLVCSFGVQNGLEKITKWMMLALLGIMIVLAINSVFLPGGAEGLKFYLLPDVSRIQEHGLITVLVAAMNQAFFTLSIGMGSMAIFGSYIGKERSLMGESVNVALLDTFVAIASGLIIFPACFAYNVNPESGPPLIFVTLPNIFNHLPGGRIWGSLFFLFMSFAALSTVFAVFENIISCTMDISKMSRKTACLVNCILMIILSLPCIFGFNLWNKVSLLGNGTNIMDFEDFLVSNIILPLGALVYVLFCVSRYGFGWDNFVKEANEGKGLKVTRWMKGYMTYVLPILIFIIFLLGIINYFK
ncbi:MAG: sodium-dependent transporter [Clostridia bacterium]|nr:sodium-dependent transporter [Clostridia bacterium]